MCAFRGRRLERLTAVASFAAAVALAFTGLLLSPSYDVESGVCMAVAQFLLLTASIFGLDYKLGRFGETGRGAE